MAAPSPLTTAVLAGLTALAVGTTGYAVWSVRQPPPVSSDAALLPPAGTDVATTSADPGAGSSDDSSTTADPADAEDSTATTTEPADVATWTETWADDGADLLVIGDGYSNLPSQWVQLWGEQVARERPVTISHWAEAEDAAFNEPLVLSEIEGPALAIWSASRDTTTIAEAADRVERFTQASAIPDAVMVSVGQSSGEEDVADSLDQLLATLPEVPVLVVVGPADLYDPGVGDAISAWSVEHSDEVALVDLRERTDAMPSAEEWAQAFAAMLDEADG